MVIKDCDINYIDYGAKENPIVLLHGWGQNIEMMKSLGDQFQFNHRIIILDLPGFGKSGEPTYAWQLDDYVETLEIMLKKLKVNNPIIIGHSFGGKIGLLYASKNKVKKLICLASPYKKQIKKESLKVKMLKTAKKIPGLKRLESFAKKHMGSTDYKNASEMMRNILVNHVNYDITEEVKKITCPTLLIWGTADVAVFIEDALELEQLIPDCGLVTYEGCTHYAYLERFGQTVNVISSFIEEEEK